MISSDPNLPASGSALQHRYRAGVLRLAVISISLAIFLFGDCLHSPNGPFFFVEQTRLLLSAPDTQWIVLLCLCAYLIVFFLLKAPYTHEPLWHLASPLLWLFFLLMVGILRYGFNYTPASNSTHALTLVGGAVIGQAIALWSLRREKHGNAQTLLRASLLVFVILLSGASLRNREDPHAFEYRGHLRETGPWDNPNMFGLLMGTGLALAAGLLVHAVISNLRPPPSAQNKTRRDKWLGFLNILFCLLAISLTANGLFQSYSRGALLGTLSALGYLIIFGSRPNTPPTAAAPSPAKPQNPGPPVNPFIRFLLKRNWPATTLICLSTAVLCFWQFRHANLPPARRLLSIANSADISWRNRVAAWKGSLQIAAEHPLFGVGWNSDELVYEYYYLPPAQNESGALETNDYLTLAVTLGIPAMFGFAMYIWLNLLSPTGLPQQPLLDQMTTSVRGAVSPTPWLKTVCRAGAIVSLVGFWFDGQLFDLPTAATFWILLELGAA